MTRSLNKYTGECNDDDMCVSEKMVSRFDLFETQAKASWRLRMNVYDIWQYRYTSSSALGLGSSKTITPPSEKHIEASVGLAGSRMDTGGLKSGYRAISSRSTSRTTNIPWASAVT